MNLPRAKAPQAPEPLWGSPRPIEQLSPTERDGREILVWLSEGGFRVVRWVKSLWVVSADDIEIECHSDAQIRGWWPLPPHPDAS